MAAFTSCKRQYPLILLTQSQLGNKAKQNQMANLRISSTQWVIMERVDKPRIVPSFRKAGPRLLWIGYQTVGLLV